MAAKLYKQASATSSATGTAISQPIEKESVRLTHDQVRIVCVRPHRSAIVPPAIEPAIFATYVNAAKLKASVAASCEEWPLSSSAAVRKAGNQAHRPSSSQLWNV